MTTEGNPMIPTSELAEAIARAEAFLTSRASATGLDPDILASHNRHELLTADLRALIAAAPRPRRPVYAAVAAYRATQDGGAEGLVWVQLPADDVSFLAGFDPDRDRTASRADMVRVMEHLRAALAPQAEDGAR